MRYSLVERLNSTMFRWNNNQFQPALIDLYETKDFTEFKFHYVQMELNFGYQTKYRLVIVFKFHYVQMKLVQTKLSIFL